MSSAQNTNQSLHKPEGCKWVPPTDDLSHRAHSKLMFWACSWCNPWHMLRPQTQAHTFPMYFSGPQGGLSAWGQDCAGQLQSMGPYPGQCGVRQTRVREAMSAMNSVMEKIPSQQDDRHGAWWSSFWDSEGIQFKAYCEHIGQNSIYITVSLALGWGHLLQAWEQKTGSLAWKQPRLTRVPGAWGRWLSSRGWGYRTGKPAWSVSTGTNMWSVRALN